jgi:DNA primase
LILENLLVFLDQLIKSGGIFLSFRKIFAFSYLILELKSKSEILTIAFSLGYDGKKSGSCFQGGCPRHGSEGGKCLVIWPRIQGFRCFHCGETGDVIDLVMLYKRCDHKTARDFLADRPGTRKP